MANEKTPLEKLQGEAASRLFLFGTDNRAALDAFLVQAFDLGATAQVALGEAVQNATASMNELADVLADGPTED
jgi:lipid-binding SYLF domain-containing protein